ncbi:MAG TPA: flagellar biosynthesis protein FlhB [Candidatus Baltobacteraceae bacterium]|jgi:flagellar biosynthetic protein FlhB|nr:flagellar biosynthesis protein FlhB [Candidatus Baltobacteraceae bacterium]
MAKPEQTEKATPKRRKEARDRGQVPKSQDLTGAAIFLVAVFALHGFFNQVIGTQLSSVSGIFERIAQHGDPTFHSVWVQFLQAAGGMGFGLLLVFAFVLAAGIGVSLLQFGFVFTLTPLKPSFSKLNPISGFKNLFSKRILVNLAKQLLKLGAVVVIIWTSIASNIDFFAAVGQSTPANIMMMTSDLVFSISWKFALLLIVVGLFDYAYERWQLEDNLKMSKQEVKDEWRQSEGNPEAKSALKRRQREFARRRMMSAVPRATVIVTNPTHFAVALEWDDIKMDAPVVVAKGADLVAKRIRDLGREHGVPIMENPPLARTLYERVELDAAVPPNLYAAVAQVIAFVYKLKRKTIA